MLFNVTIKNNICRLCSLGTVYVNALRFSGKFLYAAGNSAHNGGALYLQRQRLLNNTISRLRTAQTVAGQFFTLELSIFEENEA